MVSPSRATLLLSVVSTASWSVEARVQSAEVLGKFFVVLLSLLSNFMLNGSSTSLLVEIRVQIAGLLGKYFVVLYKVEIRVQIAGLLGKYFVVLLRFATEFGYCLASLLTNFMLNFMLNGSST
ncbi:uncharacterized protein DS421_6g190450 [Arachis hypogaea]|nr:uncharacterized protein DS421_6g190450 [Arachis hypogaea]